LAKIGVPFPGPALHGVTAALASAGHDVHVAADPTRVTSMLKRQSVDAWIVDACAESVLDLLLPTGMYVLPADNIPEVSARQLFNRWMDSLLSQLELALLRPPVVATIRGRQQWQAVQGVWLLAGSAGATDAVQQFLNAFVETPPVAFLYAQHLDPESHHQLERYTPQNDRFRFALAEGSHVLSAGQIVMITPRHKVTLHEFGRINSSRESWNTEHTPDINELIIMLSAFRHHDRGVIVFSGMGDDGREALPTFDASGGAIWAQSPGSATSVSMPESAIATGLVERAAAPAALARALMERYRAAATAEST